MTIEERPTKQEVARRVAPLFAEIARLVAEERDERDPKEAA